MEQVKYLRKGVAEDNIGFPSGLPKIVESFFSRKNLRDASCGPFSIKLRQQGKPPTIDRMNGERWITSDIQMPIKHFPNFRHCVEPSCHSLFFIFSLLWMALPPPRIKDRGME